MKKLKESKKTSFVCRVIYNVTKFNTSAGVKQFAIYENLGRPIAFPISLPAELPKEIWPRLILQQWQYPNFAISPRFRHGEKETGFSQIHQ